MINMMTCNILEINKIEVGQDFTHQSRPSQEKGDFSMHEIEFCMELFKFHEHTRGLFLILALPVLFNDHSVGFFQS